MTESDDASEAAFRALVADVRSAELLEAMVTGTSRLRPRPRSRPLTGPSASRAKRSAADEVQASLPEAVATVRRVVRRLAEARRTRVVDAPEPIDNDALSRQARFTDRFALAPYRPFLHYVPRIVNVVRRRSHARRPRRMGGQGAENKRSLPPHGRSRWPRRRRWRALASRFRSTCTRSPQN